MKGFLNQEQIDYVLFHLNNHVDLNNILKETFVFIKSQDEISDYSDRIIFILSDKALDLKEITYINQIPVLFPVSKNETSFKRDGRNIIFHHDFIKSAFFLLSGYQEYRSKETDSLGRFSYTSSVQAKLEITDKPVVNYYFDELIKGIDDFCLMHHIVILNKKKFNKFAFFLTHDIDRISYFNLNTLLYSIKLLFTTKKRGESRIELLREIFRIVLNILKIFDKNDPYWNFEFLSGKEKELGITSTYFFLPRDQKHVDSYYDLSQKKIKNLIQFLLKEGHEIGLHGTVHSHISQEALSKILKEFFSATNLKKTGIRQHRLMWKHPETAIYHDAMGIVYDSTLGFADHEGFRNSYCHPFRLFDFNKNRMLSPWEIPLNIMDTTIFHYRKLKPDEAQEAVEKILKEIIRFNGVFTILWHNSFFNENETPGITHFYLNMLKRIIKEKPEVLVGSEIINRLS